MPPLRQNEAAATTNAPVIHERRGGRLGSVVLEAAQQVAARGEREIDVEGGAARQRRALAAARGRRSLVGREEEAGRGEEREL